MGGVHAQKDELLRMDPSIGAEEVWSATSVVSESRLWSFKLIPESHAICRSISSSLFSPGRLKGFRIGCAGTGSESGDVESLLEMSLWESLSDDIGHLIIKRLPEVVEHIRFGVVCKRWYLIAHEYHKLEKSNKRRPLPMLLTPPNTITGTKPNLYALSCRGNHYRNLTLPLPYAYRYCGSSNGWLATPNPDCSVTLEYPFGGKISYIHLPVLDARLHRCFYPEFTIHRLIISPDSTLDDYTVVAIYGGQSEIATIKSGDESWFLIKPAHEDRDRGTGYSDIIFHKGLVYAVNSRHGIVAFDVSIRPPRVVRLLSNFERLTRYHFYLVESTQMDLLLVGRHIGEKAKDEGEYNEEEYNEEEYDDEGVVEQYDAEEYLEDYEGSSYDDDSSSEVEEENIEEEEDGEQHREEVQNRDRPMKLTLSDDFYHGDYFEPDGPDDVGSYNIVKKSFDKHYLSKSTQTHAARYLDFSTIYGF
uniref:KIB1-4 beta-propeller domain-containing protein n=1 Tax=Kalanchoe fedtschenkoi TaxID=63787 RepID=A0A7N0ZRH0_KALFE